MKSKAVKKLKNKKGSTIPEAIVGFGIAVLSVLMLVSAMNAAKRIMNSGDEMLDWLYREELAAEYYMAGEGQDPDGNDFDTAGGTDLGKEYTGTLTVSSDNASDRTINNVYYFVTNHDNSHQSTGHLVVFRIND